MSDAIQSVRAALADLAPASSHDANDAPELSSIYAPQTHETALDPDRPLVIGGRGAGKSFWSATLLNVETRRFVAASYPRLKLDSYDVSLGFAGIDMDPNAAPSREMLDDLIETDGHPAEKVWRAVILGKLDRLLTLGLPQRLRGSDGLVAWVDADAERAQIKLHHADQELLARNQHLIILFDALDRLGADWQQIRERTKALLRVVLAMRSYRAIKPKLFLRVDQAEDREIVAFPDASKLLGAKVDLVWDRQDLYGLLYTFLANDPAAGMSFIQLVERSTGIHPQAVSKQGLPVELKTSEQKQEAVFVALAGKYMNGNPRRGKTYTWLHNHLADALGRVSPRTFLNALRSAARYPAGTDTPRVITPKGLQAGVQSASALRLQQLKEEYGWIEAVVEPLADLNVPCNDSELYKRWEGAHTVKTIRIRPQAYLEPVEFQETPAEPLPALLKALLRIGIAERRADGRINMPDIYRVAAKLLRRGGVKPLRQATSR